MLPGKTITFSFFIILVKEATSWEPQTVQNPTSLDYNQGSHKSSADDRISSTAYGQPSYTASNPGQGYSQREFGDRQYPEYGHSNSQGVGPTAGGGYVGIGQTASGMGTFGPSSSSYGQSPSYGSNTGNNHALDYGHGSIGIPGDVGIGQPPYVSGVAGQRYGSPDRQLNLFPAENCVEKSVYFARSCEDFLLQRQRETRNARTGIDVQRRICCSLFFYYDCLSKTVIQYCRDASPTTVDIMMGQRKREMAITCRDFSREQCSSSPHLKAGVIHVLLLTLTVTVTFLFPSPS